MSLLRPLDVWQRISDDRFVCYRCIHWIEEDQYQAQSADFFDLPITKDAWDGSQRQFFELFEKSASGEGIDLFDSLEAAIAHHKKEFAWADDFYEEP